MCTEVKLIRLAAVKTPEDIPSVVPHNMTDVTTLVDGAVDVLWNSRHDVRSWDSLRLTYGSVAEHLAGDLDAHSQAVYQRLVFDLAANALSEFYGRESTATTTGTPWLHPTSHHRLAPALRATPASADDLKPHVREVVLHQLTIGMGRKEAQRRHRGTRWGSRKRWDRVDQLLVSELNDEEDEWNNYDNDELYVKMQLADSMFDLLLADAMTTLSTVTHSTQNTD